MQISGYRHPAYVRALAEFGEPVRLPRSGGALLLRPIRDTGLFDAMGPYPYLTCGDWRSLAADLEELQAQRPDLVSITAAPDPFGDYDEAALCAAFPDLVRNYKQHYVADLTRPVEEIICEHHRKETRRAQQKMAVEMHDRPLEYLPVWLELFAHALSRFDIRGIRAFSPASFEQQFGIPGTRLWLVRRGAQCVAASVTLMHDAAAYTHLLASTDEGRKLGASYLIYDANVRQLRPHVRWIDWGAVPGEADADNGLSRFKRGWATGTRPAYICGRVLNAGHYQHLVQGVATPAQDYFPAYRAPGE